jgi:hypothetical protein
MGSRQKDIDAAYDNLDKAFETIAAMSCDVLTATEKQRLLARLETHRRRLPAVEHPLINQLGTECAPETLGAATLAAALAMGLRITKAEAQRRIGEAGDLGQRNALSGELLEPLLPTVAAGQRDGKIGVEHVKVIRDFLANLPDAIDYQTREESEKDLGRLAAEVGPTELRAAAGRLAYVLDQDGPAPTDAERARRRFFTVGKQQADGMSPVSGLLDPEACATLEAVFAKWAAPGMCNPDDPKPCIDGEPPEAASQAGAEPTPTQSRCAQGHGPCGASVRETRPAQWIARHHHRLHDSQRARISCGTGGYRQRIPASDFRCHPHGEPRVPLPGDLQGP